MVQSKINKLEEKLEEIDSKIGIIISDADKKVTKLEEQAYRIKEKIEKYKQSQPQTHKNK